MAEVSTIPAYILANEHLLHWLLEHRITESLHECGGPDILSELTYVDFYNRNRCYPDHVFNHRWENFITHHLLGGKCATQPSCAVGRSLVLGCLECLYNEYMEFSHGKIHIRLEYFSWWQNMLGRMSALPIQAHAMWRLNDTVPSYDISALNAAPLLFYPYDEGVENYIANRGLNDSHIHINLAAGPEVCWLNSLAFAQNEFEYQQQAYHNSRLVRELYREIHVSLSPQKMFQHVLLARRLRHVLSCYADAGSIMQEKAGATEKKVDLWKGLAALKQTPPIRWTNAEVSNHAGIPAFADGKDYFQTPDALRERAWMARVLKKLAYHFNPLIDRLLLIYILLLNEHTMLCVHQEHMKGFRQFNKYAQIITSCAGRTHYYQYVFLNMHGSAANSMTNYAELRISPGRKLEDTESRIRNILHGYLQYLVAVMRKAGQEQTRQAQGNKAKLPLALLRLNPEKTEGSLPMEEVLSMLEIYLNSEHLHSRIVLPTIVLHLIKRPDSEPCGKEQVRYASARTDYNQQLEELQKLLARYPRLRYWVRGIDAAADEMDTPADVFAPVFRKARNVLGLRHVTYHAGEDFYHLISGIRSVSEAAVYLDYKRGDRIGHASALGVDPTLWMRTMPRAVSPERGEWLRDLCFLWKILHDMENMHDLTRRLDYDIRKLSYTVFQRSGLSPYLLCRFFSFLHLDAMKLREVYDRELHQLPVHLRDAVVTCGESAPFATPEMIEHIRYALEQRPHLPWCFDAEEELILNTFKSEAPEILTLLLNWQSDTFTIERAAERIEVPTDYLNAPSLLAVQQIVMRQLTKRGVVLETLPTSNLRIGQYKEMGQHHSLRWMGAHAAAGDEVPPFVLGTDDPGVFATDIKAEFYHLFASLCKRGFNAQDALEKLIRVDICGERSAFRPLVVGTHESDDIPSNDIILLSDSPGFTEQNMNVSYPDNDRLPPLEPLL